MELKETKKSENPLFSRQEVELTAENQSTPKMSDVEKELSEKYSVPAENIKVKKIKGSFGSREFVITANIYLSKEEKDKTEKEKKKKEKTAPATKPEEKKK